MTDSNKPFGTGAIPSPVDYRTITHSTTASTTPVTGGTSYLAKDIRNQSKEGICTAISLIQNAIKATGAEYCADFQYLLQKKYFDQNWIEGSSIFAALKMGAKYGFLPIQYSPFKQTDRDLPYDQYVTKLKSISDQEIARLLTLCVPVLKGYAQVSPISSDSLAKAILTSKSGILCRYNVGNEWWTPSWSPNDINPLRPPQEIVSGHAITMSNYDYSVVVNQTLANTWSSLWCKDGSADIHFNNYKPTEAWIPYYDVVPSRVLLPSLSEFKPQFKACEKGQSGDSVKTLQTALMILGYLELLKIDEFGIYGAKTQAAVYAFQLAKIPNLGSISRLIYRGRYCAEQTITALNKIFVK